MHSPFSGTLKQRCRRRPCWLAGLLLAFSLPLAAADLVLERVAVIDVVSLEVLPQQTVVVSNGRIRSVAPWQRDRAYPGARVLDLDGKYLIPGLIDAHVHHATDPEGADNEERTKQRLRSLLAGGVTAVRDMGGDARTLASLKRRAEIGVMPSPDIYYSALLAGAAFFSDPRTHTSSKGRVPGQADWMRAVHDDSDLDAIVLRAQGAGASGLKVYADVSEAQLRAIVAAAARRGMPVWSHAYHRGVAPGAVAASGVDVISHAPYLAAEVLPHYHGWHRGYRSVDEEYLDASFDPDNYRDLFATLAQQGTLLDATLSVFELTQGAAEDRDLMYRHALLFTRLAIEAGVRVVAGTDTVSDVSELPFPAVHYEMQLLVEDAGMSPLQALQAATLHGALALGMERDYGSIEPGKVANLVVLDRNPAEQVEFALAIDRVIKRGQVYRLEPQVTEAAPAP